MKSMKHLVAGLTAMTPALAMAQEPAPQGMGVMGQVIFFAGFILIFYFLIWRPQSKRAKEHKALMSGLNKGDEVVTSGGVAGKITKVTEDFIVMEVADNVEIKVQKVAVAAALPKGTLKDI
ncbi:preprotein translocase subunit YajC [Marinobacter lutaoensis]|jgi:preprotein translocase subunit YajC|uniref:Sec translocon accessory complex subunit YajC n=1 Tax=Marinobacter lutaoensis TaxID=135739 RepID=A0A1V2DTS8_9GAMM|nr:preprotein translocase subunit YajC [Marinobacter lutaoensis]MBI42121.1 preprotein translocase subunit YajC [Oceanospirillales bacterium]NVD35065.1 preprotein translocase subunit YajC [Marinobacter lutaoensis]ONF43987.1 preprotein translocase subunit YajC [Marinobacter lutaoensis]|tara:strand:- start:969 stop:1331 length:363 start_codon:yes stop_codon:yes gene_type:complete